MWNPRVGIGVVTYNRKARVQQTIERIRELTSHEYRLVVADDGSTDGTLQALSDQTMVVTGENRGIAWNKNRALFFLKVHVRCDVIVLLEDDAFPTERDWLAGWVEAAQRWGHVNYAGTWFREAFMGGTGTARDPVTSHEVSGQCSAFSAEALDYVGYMDTRFGKYGFEHAEHSHRLRLAGFGGTLDPDSYYLINGGVGVSGAEASTGNPDAIAANGEIYAAIMREDARYVGAWRDGEERARLLREMADACARAALPHGSQVPPAS